MKAKSKRPAFCNVFAPDPGPGRLWRFNATKAPPELAAAWPAQPGESFPKKAVAKDWATLLQPKVNIAWLPPESVFVRVVELPAADLAEAGTMVEFQIEKISPIPPAQIVWTIEILDQGVEEGGGPRLTALVMIAARSAVEEQMARLSAQGFEADHLDAGLVRELAALKPEEDGLFLIVDEAASGWSVAVAWRLGGRWRECSLLQIGEGDAGCGQLVQHLECASWGCEMEGWLTGSPEPHLAGFPAAVAALEPAVAEWSGRSVKTSPRRIPAETAQLSVRRWLGPEAERSLAPADLVRRRRDEFIDGLWFKGLGTVGVVYMFGVFLYMLALKWQDGRLDDMRSETLAMGRSFTNVLQLKAQVDVLQEQQDLRFAALDAWRSAVEQLPETLTLLELNFEKGRVLKLNGTVPSENKQDVTHYNTELAKALNNGRPLFSSVKPADVTDHGVGAANWNFTAELQRSDRP
jgi:hypothetical protein